MIDTECPLCGHKGKVPPKFSGKQVKCPECCNVFNIGGPGATAGSHPGNQRIGATAGSKAGNEKIAATSGSKAGNEKISPTSGSKAGNEKIKVNGKVEEKKVVRPNSETHHGTMKVVKGAGSNPGDTKKVSKPGGSNQGNSKKPAAKPAKSSGFGSFTFDEPTDSGGGRRRRRKGPSMVPLLFSLLLLVGVIIGGTVIYNQMFGGAEATSEQASTPSAKEEPKIEKKDPEPKKEDLPIPDQWVDVTKGAFKHGDVSIRVTGVAIAPVKLKGQEAKDAKHFVMKLEIENRGAERVDYQGWGTAEPINDANPAVMKDSSGKAYKRLTFGAGAQVEGMVLAESIQPGKMVNDVVVFEVPAESSPYVRIELPAVNLNKQGKVRLEVPKSLYGSGLVAKIDPKVDPKKDPKDPPPPGGEESKTVTLLRKQLKGAKTAKDQVDFITALGEQGAAAHTAAPELTAFVKIKNEVIQIEAIQALAKIGPLAAKESLPVLRETLIKDTSFKVRVETAKALGKMGAQAKEAMKELMEAVKEKDEELVESAKVAIKLISALE